MSADGKIALPSGKQLRLSSEPDIKRMYVLRNTCDAVLVGINTILSDDPKLTVKERYVSHPRQPLRVVLDTHGKIPPDAQVLNTTAKTLIVTAPQTTLSFSKHHIEVAHCATDAAGLIDLPLLLELLTQKGVTKLLVEGGGTVIWQFLRQNLIDDLYIYIAPVIVGGRHTPTVAHGSGIQTENEQIPLHIVAVKRLGDGILIQYHVTA
jgi:2,5-diamino-6-(ribosylamino)-4(3H)-pyrimidinone 5'-phosphate reductase